MTIIDRKPTQKEIHAIKTAVLAEEAHQSALEEFANNAVDINVNKILAVSNPMSNQDQLKLALQVMERFYHNYYDFNPDIRNIHAFVRNIETSQVAADISISNGGTIQKLDLLPKQRDKSRPVLDDNEAERIVVQLYIDAIVRYLEEITERTYSENDIKKALPKHIFGRIAPYYEP